MKTHLAHEIKSHLHTTYVLVHIAGDNVHVTLSITGHIPYPSGEVTLTDPLEFSLMSALTADPPVFTLTCVSTGGPATTVIWTQDGDNVSYDANHVLTQTVTSQLSITYSNVLTVTGREPGDYICSVANVRTPAPQVSASLTVAGE